MDTVISTNEHGVTICNRTERTDLARAATRMSYGGHGDFLVANGIGIASPSSVPFYRGHGTVRPYSGGDAA